MSHACFNDRSFGPAVGPACRGGFDFTLIFEESILGLFPHICLLLLAPIRVWALKRRNVKGGLRESVGRCKLVMSVLYAISSLTLLALWAEGHTYRTRISVASAAIELMTSFIIVILSAYEHSRATRPSHLLQLFLLIMLVCDAVRLRTLFLMEYQSAIVTTSSMHTAFTGSLLILESLEKNDLRSKDKKDDRGIEEETAGLFATRLFWYLNKLFREGYRKILTPQDLKGIDHALTSESIARAFADQWCHSKTRGRPLPLYRLIYSILWFDLLFPVVPRLLFMGTVLAQPFLIESMTRYIQTPKSAASDSTGYALIAAFGLDYVFQGIFSSWYYQSMSRFNTKMRGGLISLIYSRALRTALKDVDVGSATVVMNVDVDKVILGVNQIHEFWANPISSSITLYILYTRIGTAFVSPLLVVLIATAICYYVAQRIKPRAKTWMGATEQRITAIGAAPGNIKSIRMLGLGETVLQALTSLRELEVEISKSVRRLKLWVLWIANIVFQLAAFAMYATYTGLSLASSKTSGLDYGILFGSLSALKLVTSPLLEFFQVIPGFFQGLASLQRIEEYLLIGDDEGEPDCAEDSDIRNSSDETSLQTSSAVRLNSLGNPGLPILLEDASFAIDLSRPVLRDINLKVTPATFTMVIGKVASGKSVLLQSIIGETILTSGRRKLSSTGVAYCPQTPWLRNTSLKQNIICGEGEDSHWYDRVVRACALSTDFAQMEHGDSTIVGSKGASLSGGQKNRISLARALYARRSTVVIDDVLSGLDNRTEALLFNRVFSKSGLLRAAGVTVILATHSTKYSSEADKVIAMEAGRICLQGPYDLLKENAKVAPLLESSCEDISIHQSDNHSTDSLADKDTRDSIADHAVADDEDTGSDRRDGDVRTLAFYLKSIGRTHVTIYLVLCATAIAANTMQSIFLKWWAADRQERAVVIRNLSIFTAITVFDLLILILWFWHFVIVFIPRSSLALHAQQLNALMHASFSFLTTTDHGRITNRFSQDISLVDGPLQNSWFNTSEQIFVMAAHTIVISLATPPVAAALPFLAVACWLLQRVYLRTSRQIRLIDLEAKAPLCTQFLETLSGITSVRSFGWTEAFACENTKLLNKSQIPFYLLQAIQNWLKLVLELMVAGLVVVVVGMAIALKSSIDPGFLGLALVGLMDLGMDLRHFVESWTQLETSLGAVARIRSFANDTPQEEAGNDRPLPPSNWAAAGSLSFIDTQASYRPDSDLVLKGVSLHITAGEKIGICGRTGSGKSSLIATLFALLQPRGGRVLIDGIPTDSVPLSILRSKIIVLPQDPFFVRGTVHTNLSPWTATSGRHQPTPQQMLHALDTVGLLPKLTATALENGLVDALAVDLTHPDALLSKGEQQLFCLARAALTPGSIVVLDEATSCVDAATDHLIQRIVREAFAGRTIIAIAHRLETVMDFDRVVVMDQGRIVEIGAPGVLVRKEGSIFRALYEGGGQ